MPSSLSLRRRLRESRRLRRAVTAGVAAWLRLCRDRARWRVEGLEAVRAVAAEGPVVLVLWHEHLMMAPVHWQQHVGTPMMSIHDTSPIGRLAGELQPRFGSAPMAMAPGQSNLVTSRAVLRQARDGVTIAITADGPLGPRRAVKDAPVDWARVSGLPVVAYAFDMAHARALDTWDRLRMPLPFGRAACVFEVLPEGFARDIPTATHAPRLAAALDRVAARAQALASGRPSG